MPPAPAPDERERASAEDAEQVKPHQRLLRSKGFVPTVVVVALVGFVLASPRIGGSPPRLDSLTPTHGRADSVIVISGRNFGAAKETSEVRIAGVAATSSQIDEWSDSRITVTVPPDAGSGLVYVITRNGRSGGLLFINQDDIPQVALASVRPGDPWIGNNSDNPIQPSAARVGDLVTIYGLNFGLAKGRSEVYFTPGGQQAGGGGSVSTDALLPARDYNLDYVSWSDREITMRVPDGAGSGNVMVKSDKGWSNGRYFVVNRGAGTKTYTSPRTYSVQYGASVTVTAASGENALSLWLAPVLPTPEQRAVELAAADPSPSLETPEASLFTFTNLQKGGRYRVALSWYVDRYAVSTQVSAADVPAYDTTTDLYRAFTAKDVMVDPAQADVVKAAAAAAGTEKNPWLRARRIYDSLLALLAPGAPSGDGDPAATLRAKRGDAEAYARLLCALLRAGGIPSRIVAGYLVNGAGDTAARHFWDEIWVETLGWVPLDPLLGDDPGRAPAETANAADSRAFYFGSIGNRHLTLTKGVVTVNQISPAGTAHRHGDLPFLFTVHEESSGGLTGYTAVFEDLAVTGTY